MDDNLKEHRILAAIMFTDMVGYSALAQKNEALALELLEEHRRLLRPIFSTHGGREIETVGDAFFVEFVNALDAVRCAIEIQSTLRARNAAVTQDRAIRIRIGLHLGDVVHMDGRVHGDGVNIAARIEPLAEPGGICMSEDVAHQIQNKIDLRLVRLGRGELKNIQGQVNIFRVLLPGEKGRLPFVDQLYFSSRKKRARQIGLLLAGAALLAAIIYLIPSRTVSADRQSIAVLPFRNLSDDRENEYFSDGMTDDIINQLSTISRLKVISLNSVMRYKNTDKSIREIGRELNVANILGGSVRRSGNTLRISTQLSDANSEQIRWAFSYDKEVTKVFAIQSDVAQQIANVLKTKITSDEMEHLTKEPTENLDAYILYLNGRYHLNKRFPGEIQTAIPYFEQAIAKDSGYALAYAGLADAYTLLGVYNMFPSSEIFPKARRMASRALELDNRLAEAHTARAYAIMHYDWDWAGAEKEFQQAIALNPNYAATYSWYAMLLTITGRFPEAMKMGEQAIALGPQSAVVSWNEGVALYYRREYDRSIDEFRRTLDLDSTYIIVNISLGWAYVQKGSYTPAIDAFQELNKALTPVLGRAHPIPIAALAHVLAVSGKTDSARTLLALLKEKSKTEYVPSYWIAAVHAALGDREEAFASLDEAYSEHDASLAFLKVDPLFDNLRSDERFRSILRKIGLETGS